MSDNDWKPAPGSLTTTGDGTGHGWIVVGYPGAGTTTASQYLASELIARDDAAIDIETGDLVRAGAVDHFDVAEASELDSHQLGEYSTMRRDTDGGDYIFQDLRDRLEAHTEFPDDAEHVVVSGLRDTEAIRPTFAYFERVTVVSVHAPFQTRLHRLQARGRNDEDDFGRQDLIQRDGRESMWGTPEWQAIAHYTVDNTSSKPRLQQAIASIVDTELETTPTASTETASRSDSTVVQSPSHADKTTDERAAMTDDDADGTMLGSERRAFSRPSDPDDIADCFAGLTAELRHLERTAQHDDLSVTVKGAMAVIALTYDLDVESVLDADTLVDTDGDS